MAATTKVWVNNVAPTCEDDDLNGFKTENNNLIIGAGMSLSTADNQQTHKAIAHYAGVGDFYVDSGIADAYVLSVTGVQIAPPTYATGMRIRFVPGNDNATSSPTVNVAGLGVKNIVTESGGSTLPLSSMSTDKIFEAAYDGVDFVAMLPPQELSGTFTPTLIGGTTAGAPVYGAQHGTWVRQGKLVYITIQVDLFGAHGMAGNVLITGLPTAIQGFAAGFENRMHLLVAHNGLTVTASVTASTNFTTFPTVSGDKLLLNESGPGSVSGSDVSSTARIQVSGTYQVD